MRQTQCSSLLRAMAILALGAIIGSCTPQTKPLPVLRGDLQVGGPRAITAGESLKITVASLGAPNSMIVTLLAVGSYGLRVYQSSFRQGEALFLLPGNETRQSGMVFLTALASQARGTAQLLIQPAPPVEPLTPLVGARAIIADAQHWSMTVLIPFDVFGNPVMEGTRVELLILHPGNHLEKKLLVVRNLLAWTRVFSGIRAGRTLIVARIGQVHGFEGTLLEVAGWPVPFDLSANPPSLPADGHLLTTLSTTVIQDKFGNSMPDGTLITFIVRAPDGSFSTIPAYTIGGIAHVPLQAPRQPGRYVVQATVLGVESHPLVLQFTPGPAASTFPLVLQKDVVNDAYILQAGPMLGSLGQYIPDGTPVRFVITDAHGQVQELDGAAIAGYASVELLSAQFPKGTYRARALAGSGQATLTFTLS
jgi:hypothetical protein